MCACVDIEMGSYANQETVVTPDNRIVGIDRCLIDEINKLWRMGVRTIESCCGHNVTMGYIAVEIGDEPIMRALGYPLDSRVDRPNIFLPYSTTLDRL